MIDAKRVRASDNSDSRVEQRRPGKEQIDASDRLALHFLQFALANCRARQICSKTVRRQLVELEEIRAVAHVTARAPSALVLGEHIDLGASMPQHDMAQLVRVDEGLTGDQRARNEGHAKRIDRNGSLANRWCCQETTQYERSQERVHLRNELELLLKRLGIQVDANHSRFSLDWCRERRDLGQLTDKELESDVHGHEPLRR